MAERIEDTTPTTTDVLVVDDHRLFGDTLAMAVNLQPDMVCRGAATSAEQALEWCEDRCPDVVLLDVELPGISGLDAIAVLRANCPGVRIILITATASGEALVSAVEAGADGFLPKSHPFAEVLEAVRSVDQVMVADPRLLRRAVDGMDAAGGGPTLQAPDLTHREHEILLLLADGLAVKQVAVRLGMTVNTCRGHVATLLRKFDAHSQLGAVIAAARHGMIPTLRTERRVASRAPIGDRPPPD